MQGEVNEYGLLRSVHKGVAGPLYLLSQLHDNGYEQFNAQTKIEFAVDWLLRHESTNDDQLPGLFFGEAGVAVAILKVVNSGLLTGGPWLIEYLKEALQGPCNWPDLTHGAAGQGIAALHCSEILHENHWINYGQNAIDYLLETQEENGSWKIPEGVPGMSGQSYTGFAHGISGIIYFLASVYTKLSDDKINHSVEKGIDWLERQAITFDNQKRIKWPIIEGGSDYWHSWCHGSPGISLLYLKLYQLRGNTLYLNRVHQALKTSSNDPRRPSFSLCCGLCGLGEIYLEAAQVTGNEEWILHASYIARMFVYLAKKSSTGGATWDIIDPYIKTADLMTGNGGIVHFLSRMISKNSVSRFPLLL